MTERGTPLELWTMGIKSIILSYVIIQSYVAVGSISPWYMLSILIYLCLNISIHIAKKVSITTLVLLLSMLVTIASSSYIQPLFLLLFPLNIYELFTIYLRKRGIILFLMLVPLLLLSQESQAVLVTYGLVAILSFLYYFLLNTYISKIADLKEDIENRNEHIQQLTKSLNENKEYIRQSDYTIKLEERNRLSQEIHDKIGHSMTGALIQMEASKRLFTSDPNKSAEMLQNAIHISKEGIESIRLVLKNMKPPIEQLGVNRMKLFVDEFSAIHTVRTSLTHKGNVDIITPIQWKVIQENTKEALTNAMKYSNATFISIHIEVLRTLIKVEVSDNGKGEQKVIKGLGIIGMEERAASVNGAIIVDGSRGFSVTTLIPHG
ncbi:sensor histidine kinase [Paenibacillus sp. PL91]|uniref:sensor histidine kinase n=1 Tax=Paenibacillus sp. PL91 TaxID=2729538 RepID=UPI00145FCC4C|nr:histidine kinase [Paenibacillus sp. PL91]MBC9203946.1 sensor histidine kinase [Paenibacillus sp. PL91]